MAPTIRAGHQTAVDGSSETFHSVNPPSSISEGDLLICAWAIDEPSDTLTADAGWSPVHANYNDIDIDGGATGEITSKTATASEPSGYDFYSVESERAGLIVFAVQDAGSINAASTVSTGSGTSVTIPAITTTVDDCLLIAVAMTDREAGAFGTLTGFTKLDEVSGFSAASVAVYYKTMATAGTQASSSVTITNSEQWAGMIFAIAPAGGTTHSLSAAPTGASSTSSAVMNVRRDLVTFATGASSVTSPVAAILRNVSASGTGTTATSSASLLNIRAQLANITGASNTTDVTMAVLRGVTAQPTGATSTTAAAAAILRNMVAVLTGATSTINAGLAVSRDISAQPIGVSSTSAPVAAILRSAVAQSTGATTTSAIVLDLSTLISLAANIIGATSTTNAGLAVVRTVVATPAGAASTTDASLLVMRLITALMSSASNTTDITLAVNAVTGIVSATWTAKRPGVTWTAKRPGVTWTVRKPGVGFTGKG